MTTINTFASKKGVERRRYRRINLILKVEGRAITEEGNDTPVGFHGHTTDVSLRGFCISADRNPGINFGQQLKVILQLFPDEPPIETVGQLCWLKEAGQTKSTQIGLKLVRIASSTRGYDRWIEGITN